MTPQVTAPAEIRSIRYIAKAEVLDKVGVSYPTLWAMIREGRFPPGRRMSPQVLVWREDIVDQWLLDNWEKMPEQVLKGMALEGETDANKGAQQKGGARKKIGRPRKVRTAETVG